MAKVYSHPYEINTPDFNEAFIDGRFSVEKMTELDNRFIEECRAWVRDAGYRHKLTGQIIRFGVADGQAQYMILNGTSIMHLPLGDGYQIPEAHARGLRAKDMAAMVDYEKRMKELWGK